MPKIRRNRMPQDWQEKTQVRSGSSILAGKVKMDSPRIDPVTLSEQLAKAQHNYKKLEDEINKLQKKLQGASANSELHKKLEFVLQVRRQKQTKLWAKITLPGGLMDRAQKEQKKIITRKETFAREMKEHIDLQHAKTYAIEHGKKAVEERPYPVVLKKRIDTAGGVRKLVTVGKKRFSKE